jgi:hypothetical protein
MMGSLEELTLIALQLGLFGAKRALKMPLTAQATHTTANGNGARKGAEARLAEGPDDWPLGASGPASQLRAQSKERS